MFCYLMFVGSSIKSCRRSLHTAQCSYRFKDTSNEHSRTHILMQLKSFCFRMNVLQTNVVYNVRKEEY